jgi:adhesin transport system outer membrane protein
MSSLHDAENTRETIAFEAVRAHINLHRASIMLGEAELLAERMASFKERMDRLVSGGGADSAQAARARDYLLLASNRLARAKGQYKSAQAQYIEIVGAMPNGALDKPAPPFALNSDEDINKLIVDIQNNHPQVKSLIESSVGLYYDAQAEGKNILPEISSELSYAKKDQRDVIGGESTDARAMLRMNWSFDLGGAQRSRARQAKMQEQAALTDLELLRRNIERELRVSLANISVTKEQFDIQKSRYDTALETVDTYNKQFKGGKRSLLELMQAESDAFGVKNDYVSSEYAVLEAAYQFLSTQGKITEAIDILAFLEEDSRAHEKFLNKVDDTVERVEIPSADEVSVSAPKAGAVPQNLLDANESAIEDMSQPQQRRAPDDVGLSTPDQGQAEVDVAEASESGQQPYADKKSVDFVSFKFNPERPMTGE